MNRREFNRLAFGAAAAAAAVAEPITSLAMAAPNYKARFAVGNRRS